MGNVSIADPPPDVEGARLGKAGDVFILLLLAEGPSYGYEIRQKLEQFGFEKAFNDPGALYRTLREFEAEGAIASTWETAGAGPARRYYRLTDAGWATLERGAERLSKQAQRIERFFGIYRSLKGATQD